MKATISIAHLSTGDVPVNIRAMSPSKVSPRPYLVSGLSPRDHTKCDFGVYLDVAGTIEYAGRSWMPLAKDANDIVYSSGTGPEGLLHDFVWRQFDVGARWGSKKDVVQRMREIASSLMIFDGRIYVPDVVPVYAVTGHRTGDRPEIDIVPSRWVNPGMGLKPRRERLFSADDSAEAIKCYRGLGGRKRPASIEIRSSIGFNVDIHARELKARGVELLKETGFLVEGYEKPGFSDTWLRRLLGPGVDEVAEFILETANSWSAGSSEMLRALDGFANRLLEKVESYPEDALWQVLEDIADATRRYRISPHGMAAENVHTSPSADAFPRP